VFFLVCVELTSSVQLEITYKRSIADLHLFLFPVNLTLAFGLGVLTNPCIVIQTYHDHRLSSTVSLVYLIVGSITHTHDIQTPRALYGCNLISC